MNLIIRIISRVQRAFILKIDAFDVKKYMSAYNQWLRKQGVNITKYDGVGYIHPTAYLDGSDFSKITIGRNVTISKEAMILTHDYSIWNGLVAKDKSYEYRRFLFKKNVTIGNNCFIGAKALILPGTVIGDNVIVGAASVIKGVIPSNTVWAGNPAKQIMDVEEFTEHHVRLSDFVEG